MSGAETPMLQRMYRHENKYGIYFLFVAFFCGIAY
jgi:hypothetical protein